MAFLYFYVCTRTFQIEDSSKVRNYPSAYLNSSRASNYEVPTSNSFKGLFYHFFIFSTNFLYYIKFPFEFFSLKKRKVYSL